MLKIKISCCGHPSTLIKDENGFTSISKALPKGNNIWKNCQLFINEEVENPDYWIVIDDINSKKEQAIISKNRVFFATAELPFMISYYNDQKFLDQFYKVFSQHAIYSHNNVVTSLPFISTINIGTDDSNSCVKYDPQYNYDRLLENNQVNKTKTLSIIASDKGSKNHKMTAWHEIRYNFAIKLKEHFKDKVDLFGRGHNPIQGKAIAITPYKYHICLENQSTYNVISEKLYDSFLGLSYPIYWGAPNVYDYFSKDSLTAINIFDFKGTISKIEQAIEERFFEKNLSSIIKAKKDVLNKYGTLQRIAILCQEDYNKNKNINQEKAAINIYNKYHFNRINLKSVKRKKKIIRLFTYGMPMVVFYEIIKYIFN